MSEARKLFTEQYRLFKPSSLNSFYGPVNADKRAALLTIITGAKVTKSAAGWNKFLDILSLEFTPGSRECQAARVETIHSVILGQGVHFDSIMEGRIGRLSNSRNTAFMSERSACIAVERAAKEAGSDAAKEVADYIARVRWECKEAVMKALANVAVEVLVTTE